MLNWKNVTDNLPERSHQFQGRHMELCEVAENDIELGLFSCPDGMWGIYVVYGKLYGVSYAPAERVMEYRNTMKVEIEEEYEKNGPNPSAEFINAFTEKYQMTILDGVY